MNLNDSVQSLNLFIRDKLRNVHTIKPAVVVRNNGSTVDVSPLTTTRYRDGTQLPFPEIPDVPLMIYSGTKGGARVTVPVVAGDTVMLLCSDRDYGNLLDSTVDTDSVFLSDEIEPLGLYPIMAIPCFFTEPEGEPIDTSNIVIENGSTKITVKPSGDIDMETDANINMKTGGDITADVGGDISASVLGNVSANVSGNVSASVLGNIDVTVAGNTNITSTASVTVSGATITVDSPLTTFTGGILVAGVATVTGALTAATVSSDTISLDDHTHHYTWTSGSGSSDTSAPNTA